MKIECFEPPALPGIYNLPDNVYHDSEGISASGLKLFSRSPLHYWHNYLNPLRDERKETEALKLGRLIHKAILEPEKYFAETYALPERYDKRTKDGRAEQEFHEAAALKEGRRIVSADHHAICQAIATSVHENAAADYLFSLPGVIEQSFYWQDKETGVLCKCRPDKYVATSKAIIDLKSCSDASYGAFSRSIAEYKYHIQAAWYLRGVRAVTGDDVESFIFAAYEKEAPYASGFYSANPEMLQIADLWIENMLQDYAECLERDEWPGYSEKIQPIALPGWARATPPVSND